MSTLQSPSLSVLKSASEGKTASRGGLNVPEILVYLNSIKYPIPSEYNRDILNNILKNIISGIKTPASVPVPAPASIPSKYVFPIVPVEKEYSVQELKKVLPSTTGLPIISQGQVIKSDSMTGQMIILNNDINEFLKRLKAHADNLKSKGYTDIANELCKMLLHKNESGVTPYNIIITKINSYIDLSIKNVELSSNKFVKERRDGLIKIAHMIDNLTKDKCVPRGGTGQKDAIDLVQTIEAVELHSKFADLEIGTSTPRNVDIDTKIAPKVSAPKKAIAFQAK
jgi:hypothetical protein